MKHNCVAVIKLKMKYLLGTKILYACKCIMLLSNTLLLCMIRHIIETKTRVYGDDSNLATVKYAVPQGRVLAP